MGVLAHARTVAVCSGDSWHLLYEAAKLRVSSLHSRTPKMRVASLGFRVRDAAGVARAGDAQAQERRRAAQRAARERGLVCAPARSCMAAHTWAVRGKTDSNHTMYQPQQHQQRTEVRAGRQWRFSRMRESWMSAAETAGSTYHTRQPITRVFGRAPFTKRTPPTQLRARLFLPAVVGEMLPRAAAHRRRIVDA